jgi:predicted enzyme related to lactoylglutathione lyase
MLKRDGYPPGVPCWIDLLQPDLAATMAFYRELFGWDFDVRTPSGAPTAYAYARKDGLLVAGVGGPAPADGARSGWTSYVWVDSADDTAATVAGASGQVLSPPLDRIRSRPQPRRHRGHPSLRHHLHPHGHRRRPAGRPAHPERVPPTGDRLMPAANRAGRSQGIGIGVIPTHPIREAARPW